MGAPKPCGHDTGNTISDAYGVCDRASKNWGLAGAGLTLAGA